MNTKRWHSGKDTNFKTALKTWCDSSRDRNMLPSGPVPPANSLTHISISQIIA